MIRMIQSMSAGHAKTYFADALLKSDYYLNDQELNGAYQGRLAARLGIAGHRADKASFFALCENRDPVTGQPLTPRTREERTTGYDINFHVPKSVSVVHVLSKDNHIMEAFQSCVSETMTDIEADSKARVRKGGRYADRETGELVWVEFTHQTARPVDGSQPDPHLHAHCYVFNATWDEKEQTAKAGQFRDIKRNMPYYEALFNKRLSDKLMNLGYEVLQKGKSFEVAGVPQRVIDLFSKRTDEIGRIAKEKGITDAKALDALGAKTRSQKQKGFTMDELRTQWRAQIAALGPPDKGKDEGSQAVRFGVEKARENLSAEKCVDYALSHAFERASVMPYRRLLESATRRAIGNRSVSAAAIGGQMQADKRLVRIPDGGQLVCTTKEVLQEEREMVALARAGQGRMQPLYDYEPNVALEGQQAAAVKYLLTNSDRVTIIRGAAGTGKTTLMREAVSRMEQKGQKVTVIAPTANASRGVLREEGFAGAETVALFLQDRQMQQDIKGGVLWVDEAGLLGTKDMADLLAVATQQNARLVLGGDTRQHGSVVRGDALRILNTVGGIQTAEVNKIYRQRDVGYRDAVAALSKGDIKDGFERLDSMGVIKTIDPLKPSEALVADYISAIKGGKSGLVISPTHKQSDEVTAAIRQQLRKEGMLGKKEIEASRLRNLNLTIAQKTDRRNYKAGQVVQFNQNTPGAKRGSQWVIIEATEKQVRLAQGDKAVTLPTARAASFDVFEKTSLPLSKGDRLRITRNGLDEEKKRLHNGQVMEVLSVSAKGAIRLRNPGSKHIYAVGQDYGHLDHAHCITSYAAQGKTVDEVFIAQPAATFAATDAKQFYVSVSRGRDAVHIYTDDKPALLEHAAELGDRRSALELVGNRNKHLEHVHQMQREEYKSPDRAYTPERAAPDKSFTVKPEPDYEPGL